MNTCIERDVRFNDLSHSRAFKKHFINISPSKYVIWFVSVSLIHCTARLKHVHIIDDTIYVYKFNSMVKFLLQTHQVIPT